MKPIAFHICNIRIDDYSFTITIPYCILVLDGDNKWLSEHTIEADVEVDGVVLEDIGSMLGIRNNAFHFGLIIIFQREIADDRTKSRIQQADDLLLRLLLHIFNRNTIPLAPLRTPLQQQLRTAIPDPDGVHPCILRMFGDEVKDVFNIFDCAIGEEEELPGVAVDNRLGDKVLDGSENLSATHISLHETDLPHCLLDVHLLVLGAVLEEVLMVAAETNHVEVAVLGKTPQEDLKGTLGIVNTDASHRPAAVQQEDVLALGCIQTHFKGLLLLCVIDGELAVFGNEGDGSSGVVVGIGDVKGGFFKVLEYIG